MRSFAFVCVLLLAGAFVDQPLALAEESVVADPVDDASSPGDAPTSGAVGEDDADDDADDDDDEDDEDDDDAFMDDIDSVEAALAAEAKDKADQAAERLARVKTVKSESTAPWKGGAGPGKMGSVMDGLPAWVFFIIFGGLMWGAYLVVIGLGSSSKTNQKKDKKKGGKKGKKQH